VTRLFCTALLLTSCLLLSSPPSASQDDQTAKATVKPLTNVDVVDMLKSGLSQEIVIAKISKSACEFDTLPATLKLLKAANIPEAVILAMIQAPNGPPTREMNSVASALPSVQATAKGEPAAPARVFCFLGDGPISIYSAPYSGPESVEVFKLKCGDRIALLNPSDKQTWLKIRAEDGQEGYIAAVLVSKEQPTESTREANPSSESQKRGDIQKAIDDLEDCKSRSQNEYDTKMNTVSAMTLTPMTRVYASSRLKQNLDAELRQCRSQYESRLKAIETP
jgi:hypothetical protein